MAIDWEQLAQRAAKLMEERTATDSSYRRLIEQNEGLACLEPGPTCQVAHQDNVMQWAGVLHKARIPPETVR